MTSPIRDDQWQSIDEAIFANLKLSAVKQIRAITGGGLQESLDVLVARYNDLRAKAPEQFVCDHKEYWAHFYS